MSKLILVTILAVMTVTTSANHHYLDTVWQYYFEAKNKTFLILPKVSLGSTKKPLNGAFLNENLIWLRITVGSLSR